MTVTDIEVLDNKKLLIILDATLKFPLYKGEAANFGIEKNAEVCGETLRQIEEVLIKRCRERSLYILEKSDKTEKELRQKLKGSFYPDNIIEGTMEFLKRYDYINDYRYASNYIRVKKDSKSRRQIEYEMMAKGISEDILSDVFQAYHIDSRDVIVKILKSRRFDFENATKEQCNKQIQYLMRKGFLYDDIQSVIRGGFAEGE